MSFAREMAHRRLFGDRFTVPRSRAKRKLHPPAGQLFRPLNSRPLPTLPRYVHLTVGGRGRRRERAALRTSASDAQARTWNPRKGAPRPAPSFPVARLAGQPQDWPDCSSACWGRLPRPASYRHSKVERVNMMRDTSSYTASMFSARAECETNRGSRPNLSFSPMAAKKLRQCLSL